jgi:hypothetical protein
MDLMVSQEMSVAMVLPILPHVVNVAMALMLPHVVNVVMVPMLPHVASVVMVLMLLHVANAVMVPMLLHVANAVMVPMLLHVANAVMVLLTQPRVANIVTALPVRRTKSVATTDAPSASSVLFQAALPNRAMPLLF